MNKKWRLFEESYLNQSGFYVQAIAKDSDNKMLVCNVYGNIENEAKVNAKLISVAPEMLEMLQLMIDEFDAEHATVYGFELCVKAKELIKKATL